MVLDVNTSPNSSISARLSGSSKIAPERATRREVHGRLKFRVGKIVFAAASRDSLGTTKYLCLGVSQPTKYEECGRLHPSNDSDD